MLCCYKENVENVPAQSEALLYWSPPEREVLMVEIDESGVDLRWHGAIEG